MTSIPSYFLCQNCHSWWFRNTNPRLQLAFLVVLSHLRFVFLAVHFKARGLVVWYDYLVSVSIFQGNRHSDYRRPAADANRVITHLILMDMEQGRPNQDNSVSLLLRFLSSSSIVTKSGRGTVPVWTRTEDFCVNYHPRPQSKHFWKIVYVPTITLLFSP